MQIYPDKIPEGVNIDSFEKGWVQSRVFMMRIICYIHDLYACCPGRKSCLDVGPHLMGGTSLLKELHSPRSFTRLKLDVSSIELDDRFLSQCRAIDPDAKYLIGNIYDHTDSFDIIIASHVVEHVPNPIDFIRRLQQLSREWVIIACPWREVPLTTAGHINTIDKSFLTAVRAQNVQIYTDLSWGHDKECVIFRIPGHAKND